MVKVNFGQQHSLPLILEKDRQLLAVRSHAGQSLSRVLCGETACTALHGSELLLQVEDADVQVFKLAKDADISDTKRILRELPDVRFAGSVLVDPHSREPVLYTENIFLKFMDSLSATQCLAVLIELGLRIKQKVPYALNAFFVHNPDLQGIDVCTRATEWLKREDVEYCHPEMLRPAQRRAIHPNQWHLKKTTVTYQAEIDASANVEAAHGLAQGEGIVIAVIDDAFDIDHPEFAGEGKIVAAMNFDRRDAKQGPRPGNTLQRHGTAAAGIACANGYAGASGVAPRANLMPLKLNKPLGSRAEADAFFWAADQGADIISCSWGPAEGHWADPTDPRHTSVFPLSASTRLAIKFAATQGRNGKGCVIFFGAGNGNESADNDGYSSHPEVIAVAACNDQNRRSAYSDYGKAVWCCFPSGDQPHPDPKFKPATSIAQTRGIRTTDLSTKFAAAILPAYTDTFSGTSSACPGAAGVAALVLGVNPKLSRVAVRQILADCCDKIGHPDDGALGEYDANGHSHYYGHGRINALRAVQLAFERDDSPG
ncbi:peptidase S8 [Pseudomonas sp. MYb2]|uniref:S8 family peptidase n=1 Tax=unclassified Pseudomonas TaxID=196821 RepID=UPI000D01168C|nr:MULTISPECIES: S8 family serine peptidase [unclassified Pseudomonas]PRB55168.1 peptidase S8 [Pseudomonas sp. MYb3]PRC35545.1 peptidase S8 [Pseudomonas sp. MYb2]